MNKWEITPYLKFFALLLFFLFSNSSYSQNYQWAKSIGSTTGDENGYGIALDVDGNVYLTGLLTGTADFDPGAGIANLTSTGGLDIFFAKYTNSGNYLWAKVIGSPGFDYGYSIAVDEGGNVYISGYFSGTIDFDPGLGTSYINTSGNADIFFAKYDGSGNYIWAKSIGGTFNDESYSLVLDNGGSLYMTGYFSDTADFDPGPGISNIISVGSSDIFFAKYDTSGNYIWAKGIGGPNNQQGRSITVDSIGNVCITGYFENITDFDPGSGTAQLVSMGNKDIFIAKFDGSGNYIWAKSMGGTGIDQGNEVTIGGGGSIHITGFFRDTVDFDPGIGTLNLSSAGNIDGFFAKYDGSGNLVWAKSIGGKSNEESNGIAVDELGSVYISGYFSDTTDFDPGLGIANINCAGVIDIFFAKYDGNGNYIWAKSTVGINDENSYAIAVDTGENVYMTGYFIGTSDFDPEMTKANLTSAGLEDIFFAKYSANPTSFPDFPSSDNVIRIYPNPNNGIFTIDFAEVDQSFKDGIIEIYSMLGEKLHSEKFQNVTTKTISLNLPDGIYLLKIVAENEEVVRKILIQNL